MFHLRIHQKDQTCFFDLSWGRAQRLSKTLPFPNGLMALYQDWRHAYLSFYSTVKLSEPTDGDSLRGKVAAAGALSTPQVDGHARLVEAQTQLLLEFHRWLRHEELFSLYTTLAEVSRTQLDADADIDLFLTCTPIELARLPWESWELGATFATNRKIRMTRLPLNIRSDTTARASKQRRQRPRILVILGSDPEFAQDWQQLHRSLKHVADMPDPIGWHPGKPIDQLKTEIVQALVDPQGWDILFFAGHSNETQLTGGEIGIAPHASIRISEIIPQLTIARERGLQFALFNSCSGLSLAESLIDLGLSQVAVMREPIQNRVAQEFLVQFIQGLATDKDVHESLLSACQFLKTEKNLTYPSAYLVPSLFRYPDTELFRIKPPTRWDWLKKFIPNRYETISLSALMLVSLLLPVQDWLLERRVFTEALYRETTQRATSSQLPPTVLVQIDNQSIQKRKLPNPNPIPYDYLGEIVQHVTADHPRLIGIDYILDRPRTKAQTDQLKNALQAAKTQGIPVVLGANYNQHQWETALPDLLSGNVSGDIRARTYHMDLPYPDDPIKPFSYTLAQMDQHHGQTGRTRRSPITAVSYVLGQRWLDPLVDYSLPPKQVYTAVPAWKVLQHQNLPELQNLSQQVVIIAPGGYSEAGLSEGQDSFAAPLAMNHWYLQEDLQNAYRKMTGAEFHAYKLHHFLNQRLVIPIPDLWIILLAAIASKQLVVWIQQQSPRRFTRLMLLTGGSITYSLLSLELYLTVSAILLPIALPVLTIWLFTLPHLRPKN